MQCDGFIKRQLAAGRSLIESSCLNELTRYKQEQSTKQNERLQTNIDKWQQTNKQNGSKRAKKGTSRKTVGQVI